MSHGLTLSIKWLGITAVAVTLWGCSSAPKAPTPAPLPVATVAKPWPLAWQAQLGPANPLSHISATGNTVWATNQQGEWQALDSSTGQVQWRLKADAASTAAGSDGQWTVFVTQANELIGAQAGKVVWRQRLPARTLATPLVAGKRVFVYTAERAVLAFDAANGAPLWEAAYRGKDSLVPLQPGLIMAVGNTLLTGPAGKFQAIQPDTGSTQWQVALATARGVNEVERLVDITTPVARRDEVVCARAYQSVVGCVDTRSRRVLWTKPSVGYTGVAGDNAAVFGTDDRGQVLAWSQADGKEIWRNEDYLYRRLGTPARWGAWLVVPDDQGAVHVLNPKDGSTVTRMATDGSAIMGAPLVVNGTLLVQTKNGGLFAWRAS